MRGRLRGLVLVTVYRNQHGATVAGNAHAPASARGEERAPKMRPTCAGARACAVSKTSAAFTVMRVRFSRGAPEELFVVIRGCQHLGRSGNVVGCFRCLRPWCVLHSITLRRRGGPATRSRVSFRPRQPVLALACCSCMHDAFLGPGNTPTATLTKGACRSANHSA